MKSFFFWKSNPRLTAYYFLSKYDKLECLTKFTRQRGSFSNYDAKKQQNVKSLVNHMKKCAKYTEDTLYFEDSVSSDFFNFYE